MSVWNGYIMDIKYIIIYWSKWFYAIKYNYLENKVVEKNQELTKVALNTHNFHKVVAFDFARFHPKWFVTDHPDLFTNELEGSSSTSLWSFHELNWGPKNGIRGQCAPPCPRPFGSFGTNSSIWTECPGPKLNLATFQVVL